MGPRRKTPPPRAPPKPRADAPLTEYELLREEKMAKNRAVLAALSIPTLAAATRNNDDDDDDGGDGDDDDGGGGTGGRKRKKGGARRKPARNSGEGADGWGLGQKRRRISAQLQLPAVTG